MHDDPREEFPILARTETPHRYRRPWLRRAAAEVAAEATTVLDELDAHRAGAADWASAMMALTYAHDLLDELSVDEDLTHYRRNQCRVAAREVKDAVLP